MVLEALKILDWRHKKVEYAYRFKEYKFHLRQIKHSPMAVVGILIIAAFLLTALFADKIALYPEDAKNAVHVDRVFQAPSLDQPFGTDDMGRDIFSRVVIGSRISLMVGCVVVLISAIIGVPLGMLAGFAGGKVDELIMRIADMFMSIPYLLLAMAVAAVLGPSLLNTMIAVSIPWWPLYARLARAQTLSLKEEHFILAAQAIGASWQRMIFRHILPNCLASIIVQTSIQCAQAILYTSYLGFLGIGTPPPTPEWGLMVSSGRTFLPDQWWISVFPGLAIFVTTLGLNLLGDGMRDVLDPKMRK